MLYRAAAAASSASILTGSRPLHSPNYFRFLLRRYALVASTAMSYSSGGSAIGGGGRAGGLLPFLSASTRYPPTHPPHVYIGNEAGDADSLVSALCYAYLGHALDEGRETYSHIPMLSISRGELTLRPETLALMEIAGFDAGNIDSLLQYYDDPLPSASQSSGATRLETLVSAEGARLTLLDHNILAPKLAHLGGATHAIVDHHLDAGSYLATVPAGDARRNVAFTTDPGSSSSSSSQHAPSPGKALVGSTCTLVTEAFLKAMAAAPSSAASFTTPASSAAAPVSSTGAVLDGATATLLAGVVLIDTLNMDPAAKKGTPRDAAVLDHLMPLVASTAWGRRMTNSFAAASCSSSSPSMASAASVGSVEEPGRPCGGDEQQQQHEQLLRRELFSRLMAAKTDAAWWTSLSAAQCLRYDYKQGSVVAGPGLLDPGIVLVNDGQEDAAEDAAGGEASVEESHALSVAFGVASVLVRATELADKPHFRESAAGFMAERGLGALLCTCAVMPPPEKEEKEEMEESPSGGAGVGIRRDVVLCARTPAALEAIRAAMKTNGMDAALALAPLGGMDADAAATSPPSCSPPPKGLALYCVAFSQGRVDMSRKQVMPLFAAALSKGLVQ